MMKIFGHARKNCFLLFFFVFFLLETPVFLLVSFFFYAFLVPDMTRNDITRSEKEEKYINKK